MPNGANSLRSDDDVLQGELVVEEVTDGPVIVANGMCFLACVGFERYSPGGAHLAHLEMCCCDVGLEQQRRY